MGSDNTSTRRRRPSPPSKQLSSINYKTSYNEVKRRSENMTAVTWVVTANAVFYVLSGVTQPILMAYASHAGLANPKCQLYMFFYYIGPALTAFTLRCSRKERRKSDEELTRKQTSDGSTEQLLSHDDHKKRYNAQDDASLDNVPPSFKLINVDLEQEEHWPRGILLMKACGIAIFDIFAQSMVYAGNNLAGPTVFAIIYSSVTIWAAIFSRSLLSRSLVGLQWVGICLVVVGLALTAMDSKTVGKNVFAGACLILIGSSFHGLTYVMSEKIMTPSKIITVNGSSSVKKITPIEPEHLSIRANCAVQGIVAMLTFLLWQILYTLPRLEPLILTPMREAGTTILHASVILITISIANLVHSLTFYVTLKHFPGGATSAGVLKGLQAVLVFATSAFLLCERWGGREMCWSNSKFISLVVVVSGILIYGAFTEKKGNEKVSDEDLLNVRVEIL